MKSSIEQLQLVCDAVFIPSVGITMETQKQDIAQWDSLSHLNLIVEMEDSFGVTFTKEEIGKMKSVKDIVDILEEK